MFVLCPHCQFLVSVDARTGRAPVACPKCGAALGAQDELQDVPASIAATPIAPPPKVDWSAPEPLPVPPPVVEHAALSDAIATIVGDKEPLVAPAPQLSADAVIAAMAAKPARKPRAKADEESKPAARRPRRTKAAAPAPEPAPAPTAPPEPTPPPKPARDALMPRIGAWLASKTQSRAQAKIETPKPAAPAPRASKPVSLRERAARRAAAAAEAAGATTTATTDVAPAIVFAPVPLPEAIPVAAPPVIEPPVVESPVAESTTVEVPKPASVFEEAPPVPSVATPPPVAFARPRTGSPAPSFLRTRAHSALALPARWSHVATIGALSLLLALQLLLAQRDVLAADARWRPVVNGACGVLRCNVPTWRQPEAFTMLGRDVRPHPRAPGTLRIDASFRNDARWSQAWPRLVLSLSDIDGRVVGTRAFTAREYLGAAPTQDLLAPGQTAAIHLDVIEPAPGIVAFSFDFR